MKAIERAQVDMNETMNDLIVKEEIVTMRAVEEIEKVVIVMLRALHLKDTRDIDQIVLLSMNVVATALRNFDKVKAT